MSRLSERAERVRLRAVRLAPNFKNRDHDTRLRQSTLIAAMLFWDPAKRDAFESVKQDVTKEQWEAIESTYLAQEHSNAECGKLAIKNVDAARAMIVELRKIVEPASATGIELHVTVTNFYKDAQGKLWGSGAWGVKLSKGENFATATLRLKPEGAGDEITRIGHLFVPELSATPDDVKERGAFTLIDGKPCKCDAPQFTVIVIDGDATNTFKLGHDHDDHDSAHRRIVESIIRLATEHAKRGTGR